MKLLKSRLFIAIICIIIAALCIFSGINLVNAQNETISIVTVSSNIKKGDVIQSEMVKITTVGSYNISKDYAKNTEQVVGKFALADFTPNDFIQTAKTSDSLPTADAKLLQLDGTRVAISVTLKDFARGLSDKIVSGDIVSCIVTSEDNTTIPQELNYVEVLTTTTQSGVDKQRPGDKTEENLATVTLLASPVQARALAEYDKNSELHLALVYRGDENIKSEFLAKQKQSIENMNISEVVSDEQINSDNG